jgi:hypothetical protein
LYSDLSLPDGSQVGQGEVVRKVWRFKNTGQHAWPPGCSMSHVSGILTPATAVTPSEAKGVSRIIKDAVNVGSTVDISVDVRAPSTCTDRVTGNYKLLTSAGKRSLSQSMFVISHSLCSMPFARHLID